MQYTPTHEWIRFKGEIGRVGITQYAQKELGEIVYVALPPLHTEIATGEEAVVLESTKAAADIYSPVTGQIIAINEKLLTDPSPLNQDPENEGWLFEIRVKDVQEPTLLMSQEEYTAMLQG